MKSQNPLAKVKFYTRDFGDATEVPPSSISSPYSSMTFKVLFPFCLLVVAHVKELYIRVFSKDIDHTFRQEVASLLMQFSSGNALLGAPTESPKHKGVLPSSSPQGIKMHNL